MMVAATAWEELAAELGTAASGYGSVITELTSAPWVGPTSASMVSAVMPYVSWLSVLAAQAEDTASQGRAAAAAYEAAFAMTVPPPVIAANRVLLMTLIATNFFGQNTPAIAATEAQYMEMWAQDAAAMYGYAALSAVASQLPPLTSPPNTTTPDALNSQAVAVTQATATQAGNTAQTTATTTPQLVSATAVPQLLQQAASGSAPTSTSAQTISLLGLTTRELENASSDLPGVFRGGRRKLRLVDRAAVDLRSWWIHGRFGRCLVPDPAVRAIGAGQSGRGRRSGDRQCRRGRPDRGVVGSAALGHPDLAGKPRRQRSRGHSGRSPCRLGDHPARQRPPARSTDGRRGPARRGRRLRQQIRLPLQRADPPTIGRIGADSVIRDEDLISGGICAATATMNAAPSHSPPGPTIPCANRLLSQVSHHARPTTHCIARRSPAVTVVIVTDRELLTLGERRRRPSTAGHKRTNVTHCSTSSPRPRRVKG